ncbi:MAG: metal-sensing transcriptional repressor [Christensenellales bacterium]
MRRCINVPNVQARLKKIEGQIRAIYDMTEKDVPCEDILIQINAAKSALHKVGQAVLEGHLQHCVRDGIEHGDAEKTIGDFAKAVELFSRMG